MRLQKVSLTNFRFFNKVEIDLSADVVIIYGRNGVGKTSIFDAIEFALIGSVGRHSEAKSLEYLHNVYSKDPLNVKIDFQNNDLHWMEVKKHVGNSSLEVSGSGLWKHQRDFLYECLVHENYHPGRQEVESIAELIRATTLLSQDTIRDFVNGTPPERANVITNIAGNAYLQRCLSKAETVEKNILKMIRDEDSIRVENESYVKNYKNELTNIESRIAYLNDQGENKQATFKNIIETLKTLELNSTANEPTTIESLETFVSMIRQFSDDLFGNLFRKSNLLSDLETLSVQHAARLNRILELKKSLKQKTSKEIESQNNEKEIDLKLAKEAHDLLEADSSIKHRAKLIEALQELVSLRLNRARFTNSLNEVKAKLKILEDKKIFLEATCNNSQKICEELAESEKRIKNAMDVDGKRALALKSLKEGYYLYLKNKLSIDETVNEMKELEEQSQEIQKKYNDLRFKQNDLSKQLDENNEQIAKINQSISTVKALVANLKQHIKGKNCPLCGHDHETEELLRQAIDNQLEIIPDSIQSLFQVNQSLVSSLAEIKRLILSNETTLSSLRMMISQKNERKISLQTMVSDFELQLKSLIPTGLLEDLESKILELENVGIERTTSLQQTHLKLEAANIRFKDAGNNLENLLNNYNIECANHDKQYKQLQMVEARIAELGFKEEVDQPSEELSKKIESERDSLGGMEVARKQIQISFEENEKNKKILASELKFLGEDIKKNEQEQIIVGGDIDKYLNKCKELGIDNSDVSSIEKVRATISKKQDHLNNLLSFLDAYKLNAFIQIIQSESTTLHSKLADYTKLYEESNSKIGLLNGAQTKMSKWKADLNSYMSVAVEKTIQYYLPDIWRLFKIMIPMPHMFDGIEMRRSKQGGINLDLRYARMKEASGEPKYYLSSAQANILALAMFLTLASRQRWSRFDTIMMDDPVQHLDDLDAVSFLDTIRSLALGYLGNKRQIIMSTCDLNLYLLMLKKFSLVEKAGVSFTGISIVNNGIFTDIQYDIRGGKKA